MCSARRVPVTCRLPYYACVVSTGTFVACGSSLPGPEHAVHAAENYGEVPYPPTASLTEIIPPRPQQANCVWVDGDWVFRGKFYAWQRGGWFSPAPGARYAPSQIFYEAGGRILFAPGTWYDRQGQALPRPEALRPATTPPNDVTSEFQTGR